MVYRSEDVNVYVSYATMKEFAPYQERVGTDVIYDGASGKVSFMDYAGEITDYGVHVVMFEADYENASLKDVASGTISI